MVCSPLAKRGRVPRSCVSELGRVDDEEEVEDDDEEEAIEDSIDFDSSVSNAFRACTTASIISCDARCGFVLTATLSGMHVVSRVSAIGKL